MSMEMRSHRQCLPAAKPRHCRCLPGMLHRALRRILLTEPRGVDRVIASLRYMSRRHAPSVSGVVQYFTNKRERMDYAAYRAENLMVGSGIEENAFAVRPAAETSLRDTHRRHHVLHRHAQREGETLQVGQVRRRDPCVRQEVLFQGERARRERRGMVRT